MDVMVGLKVQGSFIPVLDLRAVFTTLLEFLHLWVNFSLQRFLSGEAGAHASCFSHWPVWPQIRALGTVTELTPASQGLFGYKWGSFHCLRAVGLTFVFWIVNSC